MSQAAADNEMRANLARAAVRTFTAIAHSHERHPMFGPALYEMYADHAYAAVVAYAIASGKGPSLLIPAQEPNDDDPATYHDVWAHVQADIDENLRDLLCNLRHMLAQNGLNIADVEARRLPAPSAPAFTEAAATAALLTCLRVYADAASLDFDFLDASAAANYEDETHEAADEAAMNATADALAAATPDEIGRAAARLI